MTSTTTENSTATVEQPTTSVPIYNAASAHQHSHSCNDPSHHHHHPTLFEEDDDHTAVKNDMLMRRKAKKNQQKDVLRAELIPGHQGDKNIDDLVAFINGPSTVNNNGTNKKSKKKSTTNN